MNYLIFLGCFWVHLACIVKMVCSCYVKVEIMYICALIFWVVLFYICVDMFSASITLILLNNCRYSLQYSLLQNQELYTAIHYITLSQRKSIFRNIKWKVAGETWYYAEYLMYCTVVSCLPLHFMIYRGNLDYFSDSAGCNQQ